MKIVHPDKWLPCDGISLEEAADTAVRCSDRHVLVVAGPGAGKTELLAQKAAFLFQTNQCREPQKILAISFKTDAAQNLKERVEKRCGTDIKGRFVSMTYDAFAKNIIDFFGIGNIKAKFPAYKQGTYFMNVINQFESLFFEEYVAAHGVWNLAIENFRGDHSVPIMTIHKSKGLEYNAVYFIGLEDSAFWNFRNQPDEDRCTFFVALSRAKASVTFTFCKKRTGMKCPMQRHNAINEFFDLLQRPGIAEVKRFQNR